jgi:hypothetical protein
VVIPLEFHRGQIEECLESWASGQSFARDRYEIVAAACRSSLDEATLSRLRGVLAESDRLLLLDEPHDMPLCAQAAAVARGEVLVFTESHCHPRHDLLAVADGALRAQPELAGFSGRSRRLTHNRLSVVEADLYEADIRYGMEEHPWRKILDQLFVVRAAAYDDAGGFCGELGHFAEWHLAARMHQRGHRVGFVPEAEVGHRYVGDWRELVEFSADFARGELRFHHRYTADACRSYFATPREWAARQAWRPHLARAAAVLARRARSRRRAFWPAELVRRLRLRARWAARARLGPRAALGSAQLRFGAALLLLRLVVGLGASGQLLRLALVRLVDATVRRERWRYVGAWLTATARLARAAVPRPVPLSWQPDEDERWVTVGFHEVEDWQGHRFRWSEPVGLVEVVLAPGSYRFTLSWLPIRPLENLVIYLDEAPVAAATSGFQASATLRLAVARAVRFSWTCEPWAPTRDRRLLGLPVASLRWEAEPADDRVGAG